jgi:hypothetical protein
VSLAEKLARIYGDVDRFAKSKEITGSGPSFSYTPVEEIADDLRKRMGAEGIVMVPSNIEVVATEDAGTTKSGTTRWRHVISVDWTLTDGTDSLTVSSVGEAMDTGDKGMNKAQTAARKYALIGAFQLSTGDDPDNRHPEPAEYRRPRPSAPRPSGRSDTGVISEAQRRRLFAIAASAGKSNDQVKALIVNLTGQDSSKGISRDKYEAVVAAVEASDDLKDIPL